MEFVFAPFLADPVVWVFVETHDRIVVILFVKDFVFFFCGSGSASGSALKSRSGRSLWSGVGGMTIIITAVTARDRDKWHTLGVAECKDRTGLALVLRRRTVPIASVIERCAAPRFHDAHAFRAFQTGTNCVS